MLWLANCRDQKEERIREGESRVETRFLPSEQRHVLNVREDARSRSR